MCGRIVYVWDPITNELVAKMVDDWEDDPDVVRVLQKARFNVPPASHLPVIAGADTHRIEIARWGFPIPQRPNGVFNTRIESVDSPMWTTLIGTHHCLFPVKGFYEWKRDGKRKTPYYVHRADDQTLLLGGLIGWRGWQGEDLRCASVITCPPNESMSAIHDRMPIIIEEADADAWLGGDTSLAKPAGDVLAIHQVGAAVGDTKNDGPELMEPIGQTGLEAF